MCCLQDDDKLGPRSHRSLPTPLFHSCRALQMLLPQRLISHYRQEIYLPVRWKQSHIMNNWPLAIFHNLALYMSPEKLKPQSQWWEQRLGFKDTFSYQKCCWSDLLFISYFEGSLGRKYVKITSVTNFSRTNALVGLPEPMNFRL